MIKFKVVKEKSLYGNMNWHLIAVDINGGKISYWYKTEKEALYYKDKYEKTNAGNKYIFYK